VGHGTGRRRRENERWDAGSGKEACRVLSVCLICARWRGYWLSGHGRRGGGVMDEGRGGEGRREGGEGAAVEGEVRLDA